MKGRIVDGDGEASGFVASVADLLEEVVGFRPYPGTLNLTDLSSLDTLPSERYPMPGDDHCDGLVVRPCRVSGVRAIVIRPLVPGYPDEKTEIIAPVKLRELFSVTAGDQVRLTPENDCDQTAIIAGQAMDLFDGVVFDLDGTIVDLQVEWPGVHAQLEELLEPYLDARLDSYSRSDVFGIAREHDKYGELDEIVKEAEVEGARSARSRDALELLDELDCPIGICTANAERAATTALEKFDVLHHIDAIIARDTIPEDKPHAQTLLTCVSDLALAPGNTLYVGDEGGDEELGMAVGTSYVHPDQLSL